MIGELNNQLAMAIVAAIAARRNIEHQKLSDGWVHVLKKQHATVKLIGYTWSLNDSASATIASDKVALYQLARAYNVPAIEHFLLRTRDGVSVKDSSHYTFPLVVKPLTGTSAFAVMLCRNREALLAHIQNYTLNAWAVSPLYSIEQEVRLIMLDDDVLLCYRKVPQTTNGRLQFFNLSKGAQAEIVNPSNEQIVLAQKIMRAVGLRLAAVDIVKVGNDWKILEVNDRISLDYFLQQSRDHYDHVVNVYERIIDVAFSSAS